MTCNLPGPIAVALMLLLSVPAAGQAPAGKTRTITVADDGFPTGADSPEGAATDLVRAFMHSDIGLLQERVLRKWGGGRLNAEYLDFYDRIMLGTQEDKQRQTPHPQNPKEIQTVYAARHLTRDGPGSYAFAVMDVHDLMFVDVVATLHDDSTFVNRTMVVMTEDGRWFVHPCPTIDELLSMGLNDESDSRRTFQDKYADTRVVKYERRDADLQPYEPRRRSKAPANCCAVEVLAPGEPAAEGGTFLLLVHEMNGQDWASARAALWSFGSADDAPLRRFGFARTYWAPVLEFDDDPTLAPNLLQVAVKHEDGTDADICLFNADYREWTCVATHQGRQLDGVDVAGDHALYSIEGRPRLLNMRTNEWSDVSSEYHLMASYDGTWLAATQERGLYTLYDLRADAVLDLRFNLAPAKECDVSWADLNPQRSHIVVAYMSLIEPPGVDGAGMMDGTLVVHDLKGDASREIAVRGRGRVDVNAVISMDVDFSFPDDGGVLQFTTVEESAMGRMLVTKRSALAAPHEVEIVGQKPLLTVAAALAAQSEPGPVVPPHLIDRFEALAHEHSEDFDRRLAHAILRFHEVDLSGRSIDAVAFSEDRGHGLLYVTGTGEHALYVADVEAKSLRPLEMPAPIRSLDLVWVSAD